MARRDNLPLPNNRSNAFHSERHNHGACVKEAVGKAAALCISRGVKLTELRRRVLELVWQGHEPVGAYQILSALRRNHPNAAPPTVYRALDFLMVQGLIHRIESLNAYIGCNRPESSHLSQFLICTTCGTSAEVNDHAITQSVRKRAKELGFSIERQTVEIRGQCPHCHRAEAT